MKLSYVTGTRILGVAFLSGLWIAACSSSNSPTTTTATGGAASTSTEATGGGTGTSTAHATGGSTSAIGGATGGAAAGGGSSTGITCGTTKSTYSETTTFDTSLGSWKINDTTSAATTLAEATTGPATKTDLCSATAGCAAFTYAFTSGATAYGQSNQFMEAFTTPQNLLGATLTFTVAVYNPAAVPIQIQFFAGGGSVGGYGWSNITTLTGTGLTAYDAATGFSTATLVVADSSSATQTFCSSDSHSIGVQLQNTTALTADGTVTLYVQKVVVTPAA